MYFLDTQYNKPVHDINGCVVFTNVKNNPFTWNGGSLHKEANFWLC